MSGNDRAREGGGGGGGWEEGRGGEERSGETAKNVGEKNEWEGNS